MFADDLVIVATSIARVKAWKEGMEAKGLRVNMGKTKFMASGVDLDVLHDSGKFPCGVYAALQLERHPYCVLDVSTGSTRNALVLKLLLRTRHTNAPAVVGILVCDPLVDGLSKLCKSVNVSWTMLTVSATLATCLVQEAAAWQPLLRDAGPPGESFMNMCHCSRLACFRLN